ncbi:MAG: 50S ribosome-binding GTPase [Treponema sp.]|nr:50S ribosome-binding GTPase [Treponema sp.]
MNSYDMSDQSIKKITVRSYEEGREMLYQMYRDNYTIVDRKNEFKPGFLGLFQKSYVVLYYTVKQKVQNPEDFQSAQDKILKNAVTDTMAVKQNAAMLNLMQELSNQMAELKSATKNDVHPTIAKIESLLEENEFTFNFISEISGRIRNEFALEELENFKLVEKRVVDWIGQSISIAPVITHKLPHVIVLVGPTGVGKTTTLSKLAANLILTARKAGQTEPVVRLITTDRTRVGAEDQLKRWGAMMEVPVDKAESSEDLKQLYDTHKDSTDYILVDTSGYSPNDYENIGKMRSLLDLPNVNMDTYLTISADKKASDNLKIIQNYEVFNFSSVIITKCDETTTYGNVLSVLHEKHKSISYITDGQKVPRNIRRASIVEFLKNLSGFTIDRIHIEDTFPEEN